MQELTGKQKRLLRGLGQTMQAKGAVGKAGVTDALIAELSGQLDHHELIKIRLSAGPGSQRKSEANDIALSLQAACVGVVGRTALLYRPNPQLDATERIALD